MSLRPRLPLRSPSHLPTTARRHASVLFALSALSNSRETQHFNKITRLPRSEHSPPLKLIQTGEVDPFPLPDKPAVLPAAATPRPSRRSPPSPTSERIWDHRALSLGRTILQQQARQTHRLQRALLHARRRSLRDATLALQEKLAWEQERAKLRTELRVAGVWILGSIATATGLAMWRFWPDGRGGSVDMGRGIAKDAALGAAAAAAREQEVVGAQAVSAVRGGEAAPAVAAAGEVGVGALGAGASSWWKGFFWKQQ